MTSFDRRLTALRDDLAAAHLRGQVADRRFAEPLRRSVHAPSVPVRPRPDPALAYDTEWLHGEAVNVYEIREGWAWGQAAVDDYVGYVPAEALGLSAGAPTHRVGALRAIVYPGPGIKAPPVTFLSYGARLAVEASEGRFARTRLGYVFAADLVPEAAFARDPVAEAERFLGIPYLWGGRTSLGLDCSALVQLACLAAGLPAPRDSDMQERTLGTAIDLPSDPATYRRGDLLFWPGHVALCQGAGRMVHATAFSMAVISEPIGPAIARIAASGDALRSARRLPMTGFG